MKIELNLKHKLKEIFTSQKLGILATENNRVPYTSVVAFVCSQDMKQILFVTPEKTQKFKNIIANPNVAIFFDNRSNQARDFKEAIGITATGLARQISKDSSNILVQAYLTKNPELESFLASKDSVILCIDVNSYHIVENFQDVTKINIKSE
ncbi:MAG: pyridoxamine 5'-phosphate oxidase family protein [Sedimentisphaeraceae bacterium JB056]